MTKKRKPAVSAPDTVTVNGQDSAHVSPPGQQVAAGSPLHLPQTAAELVTGLLVRGFVRARYRRRVGPEEREVVTYELGPTKVLFEVWEPKEYLSLGEWVELAVEVRAFVSKAGGAGWKLQLPGQPGAF